MKSRNLSPLSRSLLLLAVAALLPILMFAAASAVRALDQERDGLEREALERVRRLSEIVDRELAAQLSLVRSLAQLPLFDGEIDTAAFAELARRIREEQPLWLALNVADREGNRVAAVNMQPGRVVDIEGHRHVVETGLAQVGNVLVGPRGRPALAVRAPVLREGAVKYVVAAVVRPDGIRDRLREANIPSDWLATAIDAAGNIVARTAGDEAMTGQPASERARAARARGGEGIYEGRTLEGVDTVSAYRMSPKTGWSVHIGVPREIFQASLVRSRWLIAGSAAASILLAGIFTVFLVRELRLRRREWATLEQAKRMESLGRLTGGVAHDFNNLLTVVIGNLDLLDQRVGAAEAKRPLQAIRRAAERGAHLTRELLAFSRGGAAQPRVVDVNGCVRACLGMLRQSLRFDIEIELDLADALPPVLLDPIQLDLALLNMAVNARDAMPNGGMLRISTKPANLADGRRGVALAVADTGSGIAPDLLPHVFEPFFTTKETGKGTGLGLTQVYGFAAHSGGAATVASRPREGTTVTLTLPEAGAAVGPEPTEDIAGSATTDGGRILLVDDDEDVRSVTATYLRDAGFTVEEAANAPEALAKLDAAAFDMLVSDIVMPGTLDGIGLAREARRRWPALPVLLVSGYSAFASEAVEDGLQVVAKPFKLHRLATTIREALARRGNDRTPPTGSATFSSARTSG